MTYANWQWRPVSHLGIQVLLPANVRIRVHPAALAVSTHYFDGSYEDFCLVKIVFMKTTADKPPRRLDYFQLDWMSATEYREFNFWFWQYHPALDRHTSGGHTYFRRDIPLANGEYIFIYSEVNSSRLQEVTIADALAVTKIMQSVSLLSDTPAR